MTMLLSQITTDTNRIWVFQDTVMAIQALATVAGHFSGRKLDMTVNITHDGKPDFGASFKLSEDNAIVLQMAEVCIYLCGKFT